MLVGIHGNILSYEHTDYYHDDICGNEMFHKVCRMFIKSLQVVNH